MTPVRTTDYFAIIPGIAPIGVSITSQYSTTQPLFKLPNPVISRRLSAVADFFFWALMVTTVIFVAIVMLNWSP